MTAAAIRIGSRGSALAMAQTSMVRDAFVAAGHVATIIVIETSGDRRAPDTAWGEGAFVTAIEDALLEGTIDVAVHSAKDIPTDEDPRLRIAAYLPRADPRDALVVRRGATQTRLDQLPAGSRVGTDSPRRTGFLRAVRPDLHFHPLHGNVDTRLRRLDAGDTDALILACAGLERLGLSDRIAERFEPAVLPPAPGQGAIAVQIRSDDALLGAVCEAIDDQPTRMAVQAERAFLRASGGGCRSPIGAVAHLDGEQLELIGGHARPDGSEVALGRRAGPSTAPEPLGSRLADELALADRLRGDDHAGRRVLPRVIVTRPAAQSGTLVAALRAVGLDPVVVPAIETELAESDGTFAAFASALPTYAWVVLTSANGADALIRSTARMSASPGGVRVAAIGPATRSVLEQAGLPVAFEPPQATSTSMAATLPIARGDRVLVVRGDLAGHDLAAALRTRGAIVDDAVGYRTREAPMGSRELLREAIDAGPIAALTFTSGSTARGLRSIAEAVGVDLGDVPAICIGEETAREASAAGFRIVGIAETADAAALADRTAAVLARQLQEIA